MVGAGEGEEFGEKDVAGTEFEGFVEALRESAGFGGRVDAEVLAESAEFLSEMGQATGAAAHESV